MKFQIRSAALRNALGIAEWKGPSDKDDFFERSGLPFRVEVNDRWMQYRAILITPDGGSTPSLEEVHILHSLNNL